MNKDKDVKETTPDPRLFDNRTIERNIKRGVITRKEFEKHLKTLPDSKDKVRTTE